MRMRFFLSKFLLISFLASCQQNKIEKMDGYWLRYADEQIENPYFPFELHYKNDTLYMIDGFHFTHQASFLVEDDTLVLTFSNGSKLKVNYNIEADSIQFFGKGKFFKTSPEELTSIPNYNLIGYKTDQILKDDIITSSIHLIKMNDSVKVILNDKATDLKDIEHFLACEDCHYHPYLNLYIGENIEFRDLLSAYKWIAVAGISQVTLITDNSGFQEFYIEKDYINIDDSLMEEFFEEEGMRPFPAPKTRNTTGIILTIKDSNDFGKLNTIEDSSEYLVLVDHQISILNYLELNQRIKGKQNIEKTIKRLTTIH